MTTTDPYADVKRPIHGSSIEIGQPTFVELIWARTVSTRATTGANPNVDLALNTIAYGESPRELREPTVQGTFSAIPRSVNTAELSSQAVAKYTMGKATKFSTTKEIAAAKEGIQFHEFVSNDIEAFADSIPLNCETISGSGAPEINPISLSLCGDGDCKLDVVWSVDNSGSMRTEQQAVIDGIDGLVDIINQVSDGDYRLALQTFGQYDRNGNLLTLLPLTPSNCGNINQFKYQTTKMVASGFTEPWHQALESVARSFAATGDRDEWIFRSDANAKILVIITDTVSHTDFQRAIVWAQEMGRCGIRLVMIWTSTTNPSQWTGGVPSPWPTLADFFDECADLTNGIWVHSSDGLNMTELVTSYLLNICAIASEETAKCPTDQNKILNGKFETNIANWEDISTISGRDVQWTDQWKAMQLTGAVKQTITGLDPGDTAALSFQLATETVPTALTTQTVDRCPAGSSTLDYSDFATSQSLSGWSGTGTRIVPNGKELRVADRSADRIEEYQRGGSNMLFFHFSWTPTASSLVPGETHLYINFDDENTRRYTIPMSNTTTRDEAIVEFNSLIGPGSTTIRGVTGNFSDNNTHGVGWPQIDGSVSNPVKGRDYIISGLGIINPLTLKLTAGTALHLNPTILAQYYGDMYSVQYIILENAIGGTFTVTYEGETTAPISYNATKELVFDSLNALPSLAGNIKVTTPTWDNPIVNNGADSYKWAVYFTTDIYSPGGGLYGIDVPLMTLNSVNIIRAATSPNVRGSSKNFTELEPGNEISFYANVATPDDTLLIQLVEGGIILDEQVYASGNEIGPISATVPANGKMTANIQLISNDGAEKIAVIESCLICTNNTTIDQGEIRYSLHDSLSELNAGSVLALDLPVVNNYQDFELKTIVGTDGTIEIKFDAEATEEATYYIDNVELCVLNEDGCEFGARNAVSNHNFAIGVEDWDDKNDNPIIPTDDPDVWDDFLNAIIISIVGEAEVRQTISLTPYKKYTLIFEIISFEPEIDTLGFWFGYDAPTDSFHKGIYVNRKITKPFPTILRMDIESPSDGQVTIFFRAGTTSGIVKVRNVLVCDAGSGDIECSSGYSKISYDNFETNRGAWAGGTHDITNQLIRLDANGGDDTLSQTFNNITPGAVIQLSFSNMVGTYKVEFHNDSVINQFHTNSDPGTKTYSTIVQNSGTVTIIITNLITSEAEIGNVLICEQGGSINECDGSISEVDITTEWEGIPRKPVNIFSSFIRYTIRDPNNPLASPTIVNHIVEKEGVSGIPSCAKWKQQGQAGITSDRILKVGLTSSGIASINTGDFVSVSTRSNWIWGIPDVGGIQDILTITLPLAPFGLIESAEIFFLMNQVMPDGADTTPVNPSPLSCSPDPGSELAITIRYTSNTTQRREFTTKIDKNNLWQQNTDFTTGLPWDTVSATDNGRRGSSARWESFLFPLDTIDGKGLDQCTIPIEFDTIGQGVLNLPDFNFDISKGIFVDECDAEVFVKTITDGAFTNEIQSIVIPSPTGGTWTLTSIGAGTTETTDPIPWNANAAIVQSKLEALVNIGSGNVAVTGNGTSSVPFLIEFVGSLSGIDIIKLQGDGALLEGSGTAFISTLVNGTPDERQIITRLTGTQDLIITFAGDTVTPLAYNASLDVRQSALEAISSIGVGNVRVTGSTTDRTSSYNDNMTVDFINSLGNQNVPQMLVEPTDYSVSTEWEGGSGINEQQRILIEAIGGTFSLTMYDDSVNCACDVEVTTEQVGVEPVNPYVGSLTPYRDGGDNLFEVVLLFDEGDGSDITGVPGTAEISIYYDENRHTFVADNTKTWEEEITYLEQIFGVGNVIVTSYGYSRAYAFRNLPVVDPDTADATVDQSLTGTPPTIHTVRYPWEYNERQTLTMQNAIGGTYTLTFDGETTTLLAFDADSTIVYDALTALTTIGAYNASVTDISSDTYSIFFINDLSSQNVSLITLDDTNITQSAESDGTSEIQKLQITPSAEKGTFIITFEGWSTIALNWDSTPAEVQTALEDLSNLSVGDVIVTGTTSESYTIAFKAELGNVQTMIITSTLEYSCATGLAETTSNIPFDADAATLKAAITSGISWLTDTDITVTEEITGQIYVYQWIMNWVGDFAKTNIRQTEIDGSLIIGGGIDIDTVIDGGATNEQQQVRIWRAFAGSFQLGVIIKTEGQADRTEWTSNIPWNTTAEGLQSQLTQLPSFSIGDIRVIDEGTGGDPDMNASFAVWFAPWVGDIPQMRTKYQETLLCDPLILTPVDVGPYNYEVQDCDDLSDISCQSGPLICRPGEGGEEIEAAICCTNETIPASANVSTRLQIERDLFDPNAKSSRNTILTVRELAVLKGLRIGDYVPYERNWTTGELNQVPWSTIIRTKKSFVLIETDLNTKNGRNRVKSHLSGHREILPTRSVWPS